VGTSKILAQYKGSTISLQAAVHLGNMPGALMKKKKKKKKVCLMKWNKNIQNYSTVKLKKNVELVSDFVEVLAFYLLVAVFLFYKH
jgi:hypothetical protein